MLAIFGVSCLCVGDFRFEFITELSPGVIRVGTANLLGHPLQLAYKKYKFNVQMFARHCPSTSTVFLLDAFGAHCMTQHMCVCVFVCLFVRLFVCLFVCLCFFLCVCVCLWHVLCNLQFLFIRFMMSCDVLWPSIRHFHSRWISN